MADTAFSPSWVVWLQQFHLWKTSRRNNMVAKRRENKFLFLTACRMTESCKDSGFKDSTLQHYSVEVEASNK